MRDIEALELCLPLCPHCGFWWSDKSEVCVVNHKADFAKWAITLGEIAKCESANHPGPTLPLVEFNDHHERGYD